MNSRRAALYYLCIALIELPKTIYYRLKERGNKRG